MVGHWNRLLREVITAPSLSKLMKCLLQECSWAYCGTLGVSFAKGHALDFDESGGCFLTQEFL